MSIEKIQGRNIVIIQNHEEGEQVRKHRKRRINKKWLKKYGVYGPQKLKKGQLMVFNGTLYMSRLTYKQLKEQNK